MLAEERKPEFGESRFPLKGIRGYIGVHTQIEGLEVKNEYPMSCFFSGVRKGLSKGIYGCAGPFKDTMKVAIGEA